MLQQSLKGAQRIPFVELNMSFFDDSRRRIEASRVQYNEEQLLNDFCLTACSIVVFFVPKAALASNDIYSTVPLSHWFYILHLQLISRYHHLSTYQLFNSKTNAPLN